MPDMPYLIVSSNGTLTEAPGAGLGAVVFRAGPDVPATLEVTAGTAAQARALRGGGTIGAAPVMPMRLIAPHRTHLEDINAGRAWGLDAIGATGSGFDGSGIIVAVLDTGIDPSHPAFAGIDIVQRNFTGAADNQPDGNGHGTHCAGTIFGRSVNGQRIGIAPNVKRALIGKVLDDNGAGSTESIVRAISWAAEQGAHVISLSVGLDFPGLVRNLVEFSGMEVPFATARALVAYRENIRLFDSLTQFIANGGLGRQHQPLLVAAAGNESARERGAQFDIGVAPPAVAQGFLSVGALAMRDGQYHVADFSNSGPVLSAPGVGILSAALGGGVRADSGTSMATPHVAGAAALWAQYLLERDGFDAQMLASHVLSSCTNAGFAAADRSLHGAGIVHCPGARL